MATVSTGVLKTMARRPQRDKEKSEGVNVLTSADFGVYIEGAEKTIEMYERGEISREDLYSTILDLEIVYKSKD